MDLTPALTDLRVAIARTWRKPLYQLAASAEIHPCTLSGILSGRLPLTEKLETRLRAVLDGEEALAQR